MENDYLGWNEIFMVQDFIFSLVGDKVGIFIKYDCNVFGDGNVKRIQIGIGVMYLFCFFGMVGNGLGFENCGCVSCLWNFVIIWCNNVCFFVCVCFLVV